MLLLFSRHWLYLVTSRLLHFLIILVVKKFARNESLLPLAKRIIKPHFLLKIANEYTKLFLLCFGLLRDGGVNRLSIQPEPLVGVIGVIFVFKANPPGRRDVLPTHLTDGS